jgi:outer membrane lipoprotein carrier protein
MNPRSSLTGILLFVSIGVMADPDTEAVKYPALLNQYLSGITTLSSDFEQNTVDRIVNSNELYQGQLWIAKPHQFRVDTESPSSQSLISDGSSFWSYDEDLEQVIISTLNKDLAVMPILLFSSDSGNIENVYEISGYTDELGDHFLLEPKSETGLFQSLVLEFDQGVPLSIRINAATGQQTTIRLDNVVLNEGIADSQFFFRLPEGIDVIDER